VSVNIIEVLSTLLPILFWRVGYRASQKVSPTIFCTVSAVSFHCNIFARVLDVYTNIIFTKFHLGMVNNQKAINMAITCHDVCVIAVGNDENF